MADCPVLTVADVATNELQSLLGRYGLGLEILGDGASITGSYWGAPEAGIAAQTVYVRNDTPVHSLLHETCHVICMCAERRADLVTDAGGDDLEEAAVCYLQLLLAARLVDVGRERLMRDMDTWGYGFRLGSTRRWFAEDATDAHKWLIEKGIVDTGGALTFALRA